MFRDLAASFAALRGRPRQAERRAALRERNNAILGGGQAELKGKILRMGTMGDLSADDIHFGLTSLALVLAELGHATPCSAGLEAAQRILHEQRVPQHA